jgi:hypothetical protein
MCVSTCQVEFVLQRTGVCFGDPNQKHWSLVERFSRVWLSAVTMLFRPTSNRLVESVGLWLGSPKRTPVLLDCEE